MAAAGPLPVTGFGAAPGRPPGSLRPRRKPRDCFGGVDPAAVTGEDCQLGAFGRFKRGEAVGLKAPPMKAPPGEAVDSVGVFEPVMDP